MVKVLTGKDEEQSGRERVGKEKEGLKIVADRSFSGWIKGVSTMETSLQTTEKELLKINLEKAEEQGQVLANM